LCSDRKDKVFALLSLCGGHEFQANYAWKLSELFVKVASALSKSSPNVTLNMLLILRLYYELFPVREASDSILDFKPALDDGDSFFETVYPPADISNVEAKDLKLDRQRISDLIFDVQMQDS
jgi:hypothetical protein